MPSSSFLYLSNPHLPGLAVRFWQLGIEMRPFFNKESLWAYPFFAGVGGSFGYWLTGVEQRQLQMLSERRESLIEKRRRRAERESKDAERSQAGGVAA
jgi:hypothetical protein